MLKVEIFMYKIENYKKNTITLDEIEKLLKIDDYTVLYDEVNKLIDEGRINIIKIWKQRSQVMPQRWSRVS